MRQGATIRAMINRISPGFDAPRLVRLVEFLQTEAAGGLVLAVAAAAGLVLANSPGADFYRALLELPISLQAGSLSLAKPLLLWVNDGLMAIFFLLVALEIKREVTDGELSSRAQVVLPAFLGIGGMAVPALIYTAINRSDVDALRGWAIPTATDIAFALGVMSLLGSRVPAPLKVLLTALAIIDDLAAIVVIALFYSSGLSIVSLCLAGVGLLGLYALNRCGVTHLAPYVMIGVFLWVCVLKSGVHATLAGVALAFAIPAGGDDAPLYRMEHALHGWVAFAIMPIFAFANAGVSLAGISLGTLLLPIPFGILAGLAVGKPLGVMLAGLIGVRLRIATLPEGVTWPQLLGMSLLTGIGFTMSLFVGTLAFEDVSHQINVRLGALAGSLTSAVGGSIVLWITSLGTSGDPHEAQR